MNNRLSPLFVTSQITALKVLFPELADDDEAWALSIESETDVHELLRAAEDKRREAKGLIAGLDAILKELEERQGRFIRREQAMRDLQFRIMQAADLKKIELAEATLTIRNGTPRVLVLDEAAIPDIFMRIKREPNKILLKEQLELGIEVPGCELSNAEQTLSIRTK